MSALYKDLSTRTSVYMAIAFVLSRFSIAVARVELPQSRAMMFERHRKSIKTIEDAVNGNNNINNYHRIDG